MVDTVFGLILVLNLTGIFRFLAPQFNVGIGVVSLVLLALHVLYLAARPRSFVRVLRQTSLGFVLVLVLLWPLLSLFYSGSLNVREAGLQVYYAALFSGTVVFAARRGPAAAHKVFALGLGLTFAGLLLSMLVPDYFAGVAVLAGAHETYHDRAFGFFLQPNVAASALVFLFLAWHAGWSGKSSLRTSAAVLVLLGLVLLTGSRSGALMAALVCALIVAYSLAPRPRRALSMRRTVAFGLVLSVGLGGGLFVLHSYASSRVDGSADLNDRIALLTELRLSEDGLLADASVRERLLAQQSYLDLVRQRPLTGYGLGSESRFLEQGPLWLSAHSSLLSNTLQYGAFYPMGFLLLLLQLYRRRERKRVEEALGTNFVLQFALVTFLVFTINGGILQARYFYVVWAWIVTVVELPELHLRNCHTIRRTASSLGERSGIRAGGARPWPDRVD